MARHAREAGARRAGFPRSGKRRCQPLPRVTERPLVISPQFVLKHEALAHLREVAPFPNTLNPHEEESLALVGAMIDQVMALHPKARWLHIGCDEVGAFAAPPPVLASRSPSPTSWLFLLNGKIAHVPKDEGVAREEVPREGTGAPDRGLTQADLRAQRAPAVIHGRGRGPGGRAAHTPGGETARRTSSGGRCACAPVSAGTKSHPGVRNARWMRWSPGCPAGSPACALSASLPLETRPGRDGTCQPPGVAGPELGRRFAADSAQDSTLFSRGNSLAVKYT